MNNEEVVVSTGVRFGIRDVPVIAFRDLQRRLERGRPRAPVTYIEDKGREEENPNDPDYERDLAEWNEATEMTLMDFILITGTKVIDIPEGVEKVEDEGWADESRYLGNDVAEKGGVRYIQWIKYVACPTAQDFTSLLMGAGRKLGVTEEDVAEAATMFQGGEKRPANRKPPPKAHSRKRD